MEKEIKPIDECKTVAELLANPTRWAQGHFALNKDGVQCSTHSPVAWSFCLAGGMNKIYSKNIDYADIFNKVDNHIRKTFSKGTVSFNDTNNYETVYNAVKELGI